MWKRSKPVGLQLSTNLQKFAYNAPARRSLLSRDCEGAATILQFTQLGTRSYCKIELL
jgi:hypothetical protein